MRTALPEADPQRLRARFRAFVEQFPPPSVQTAIDAIVRLLSGEREDLSHLPVNLSESSEFERKVYAAASAIPPGETRTYGELAAEIGAPEAAQALGQALGRNPCPIIVPCHRILGADGKSGGFSAPGGASTKLRMLDIEGARRGSEPGLFEHLPWAAEPSPSRSPSDRPSRAR